jgi:hypothetical protein
MSPSSNNEASPGDLLASFNGRSLKTIIVFTVVVHAVLLLTTSGGYLWRVVTGAGGANLSEDERMDLAIKETSAAMRRIAEQHGLKPQELGSRFAAPTSKAPPPKPEPAAEPKAEPKAEPAGATPAEPEEPKSAIEKELKKAVPGPAVPADEDLFK